MWLISGMSFFFPPLIYFDIRAANILQMTIKFVYFLFDFNSVIVNVLYCKNTYDMWNDSFFSDVLFKLRALMCHVTRLSHTIVGVTEQQIPHCSEIRKHLAFSKPETSLAAVGANWNCDTTHVWVLPCVSFWVIVLWMAHTLLSGLGGTVNKAPV